MVFLPQEVIAKKRDGEKLSREEILYFIAGLNNGTVKHEQAAALAMAIYFQNMDLEERISLTEAMRDSGEVLDWSDFDGPILDKHSTGGVGDNVSLMLAPIWAAVGANVPMISGRGLGHTGGTLDKFDAIPGYTTSPDNALFRQVVREVGCAIIGQTTDLAPADKIMYGIRDVTATVENVSLITSSILSKKLAAGLDALVLDVKVGTGAFMRTADDADELANSLVKVANGAGVKTSALITDMNEPLASAAGNALEVRNAVEFLSGAHQDNRLLDVTIELAALGLGLAGLESDMDTARSKCLNALNSGAAAEKFGQMVSLLGGPVDFVENYDNHLPVAPIVRDVFAEREAQVRAIDAKGVGMAVVVLGGGRKTPTDQLDYAVGFDQIAPIGTNLSKDVPIARLHAADEASAAEASARLRHAYQLDGEQEAHELFHGLITA
ncbi:thymidine phosphorylase [Maritalea porphyrae]|uniref:Thymidine phosphorylase n=1 Tax=Maritalea porphyrae TaxID=880732 RepID=A0ABQ5UQ88_9HYPH|nr:thymidine phosphorylase [Maritalea porphyrae]GLQ17441.1 thymidine phosphorylase [Maritalea porphyrae]